MDKSFLRGRFAISSTVDKLVDNQPKFVDKKALLSPYLARIMNGHRQSWRKLVLETLDFKVSEKSPGDPVTKIDLAISNDVKEITVQEKLHFYSEEEARDWKLPLIIIDPIDGTRELIERRPECAVSVALIKNWDFSSNENEGWIFNPFTDETFTQESIKNKLSGEKLVGYVSRSEWKNDLYKNISESQIELKAVGSIAYKLALLSHGKIDFVVSLKPKNIWDIAAGTILCKKLGLEFYSEGKRVTQITNELYRPPLIWCNPTSFSFLSEIFSSHSGKDR